MYIKREKEIQREAKNKRNEKKEIGEKARTVNNEVYFYAEQAISTTSSTSRLTRTSSNDHFFRLLFQNAVVYTLFNDYTTHNGKVIIIISG